MILDKQRFSFEVRPKPVAGDMRIAWRLAVTLLILSHSKKNKASLAKLHLMNDAVRSNSSRSKLVLLLANEIPFHDWRMRVEPAFSRNLDFLMGDNFAEWVVTSNRAGVQLTAKGIAAAEEVLTKANLLEIEKEFIVTVSKSVTEKFVKKVTTAGHKLI